MAVHVTACEVTRWCFTTPMLSATWSRKGSASSLQACYRTLRIPWRCMHTATCRASCRCQMRRINRIDAGPVQDDFPWLRGTWSSQAVMDGIMKKMLSLCQPVGVMAATWRFLQTWWWHGWANPLTVQKSSPILKPLWQPGKNRALGLGISRCGRGMPWNHRFQY